MAFLAPLLGAAMQYQASMQPSYYGSGAKKAGKSLAVMEKFPLLQRPHRYATGGRLAVMEKFPLLQRPHRYATGGQLAVMEKFPLLQRPHRYATGGAVGKRRAGRGPLAAALGKIPLLGMIMGPIAEAFGKGRRGGAAVRKGRGQAEREAMDKQLEAAMKKIYGCAPMNIIMRDGDTDRPFAVHTHFPPGACGEGVRRRKAHGGSMARDKRTAHRVEHATGMHTVRGYTRSDGKRVKAHLSANPGVAMGGRLVQHALAHHGASAAARRHRVAPHVRHTASGPVRVKSHLAHGKGGSMLRAGLAMMAPRMKQAMTGNLHPAARHYTGRGRGRAGLLSPA